MLCGKPVVGANSGGIRDIIKDGENGYMFKLGDSEDLAMKLINILNDSSLGLKMGKRGQSFASGYLEGNIARQYREVFQSVL